MATDTPPPTSPPPPPPRDVRVVTCPHCGRAASFQRDAKGRWMGTAAGAGLGAVIAGGLGIAGYIASAPIAIPATIVGAVIFGIFGNRVGKAVDDTRARCPNCGKSMVL